MTEPSQVLAILEGASCSVAKAPLAKARKPSTVAVRQEARPAKVLKSSDRLTYETREIAHGFQGPMVYPGPVVR